MDRNNSWSKEMRCIAKIKADMQSSNLSKIDSYNSSTWSYFDLGWNDPNIMEINKLDHLEITNIIINKVNHVNYNELRLDFNANLDNENIKIHNP